VYPKGSLGSVKNPVSNVINHSTLENIEAAKDPNDSMERPTLLWKIHDGAFGVIAALPAAVLLDHKNYWNQ
jgi:hypothetical protein